MNQTEAFIAKRNHMNQKIIDTSKEKVVAVSIAASSEDVARFLKKVDEFERKSRCSRLLVRKICRVGR